MLRRIFNLAILAAILVGGVLAWRSGEERARLEARYRRMAGAAGDLEIVDPTKVYLLALDAGEPLHFTWRMYGPANYPWKFSHGGGGVTGSSSGTRTDPADAILRVRFRRDAAGKLQIFSKEYSGSNLHNVDDELAKFLAGREGQLIFERLAVDRPVELGPSDSATLLRVAMPASMIAEAREALPWYVVDRHVPDLFKFTVGPPPSQP